VTVYVTYFAKKQWDSVAFGQATYPLEEFSVDTPLATNQETANGYREGCCRPPTYRSPESSAELSHFSAKYATPAVDHATSPMSAAAVVAWVRGLMRQSGYAQFA